MTAVEPSPALEKPDSFSLVLNGLPLLLLLVGFALAWTSCATAGGTIAAFVAWLYIAPPVLARALITVFGKPSGRLTQSMPAYRVWWTLVQLQMPFNRLPWLEELLRFVPGLYSMWIRTWGGEVSPFSYMGPGALITDRTHVKVEKGAVLGMKCALAGHMVVREDDGRWLVIVAAPVVEREAIVGGDAGLGPGAVLRAGHMLPTGRRVAPFAEWPRRREGAP